MAFSPDGKWLAIGGLNLLAVYDAVTGKHRTNLSEIPVLVRTLHFSPDGCTLVAGTGDSGDCLECGHRQTPAEPRG